MNDLHYFLISPFFMNEVEKLEIEAEGNNKIIKFYEQKEELFDKAIAFAKRRETIILVLSLTTTFGLTISLGIITGIVVYSVLNYYTRR